MLRQFFMVLSTDITNVAIFGWLCIILGHWSECGKIRRFEGYTKDNWSTMVQSGVSDWKILYFYKVEHEKYCYQYHFYMT